MAITKFVFRKLIFPGIVGSGMEKLLTLGSNSNNLIIMYHGVSPSPDFELNGRSIESGQFEQHLQYLKKNFEVISLKQLFEDHKNGIKTDKKRIAITFDDGYLNNYLYAFPLLKKYGLPATFFIIGNTMLNNDYYLWADIVDIIRKYSSSSSLEFDGHKFPGQNFFSQTLNISLNDYIKKMGSNREEALIKFKQKYDFEKLKDKVNHEQYMFMSKDQMIEMSQCNLVEIGAHSFRHFNLGNISPELAKEELVLSKSTIENMIQKEVISVAFPDGNYSDVVKKLSLDAGYKNLLAVDYQCNDDLSDSSILSRHCISNTTTYESNMIQVNRAFASKGF